MSRPIVLTLIISCCLTSTHAPAQLTRDQLVLRDRATYIDSTHWVYGDLDRGIEAARKSNKPLFVVFRCIPCEACQQFDEDVAQRDPKVRDLLDQYVCIRIPRANDIDLSRFQFDFDQSWAAFLMNADGTLYARYGTRSGRDNEEDDISLDGLRRTLAAGLETHREYPKNKAALAGKQVREFRFRSPLEYPNLSGQFQADVNYEQNVARSCVHCHMLGEGERIAAREEGNTIPDDVLFPYPHPKILGLSMDPKEVATIQSVRAGSSAEEDGFRPGDAIRSLDGQAILSTADIQWVLHHAPDAGMLRADVERAGQVLEMELTLALGWRRREDISWRVTTWDLRRMGLGGLYLERLASDEERPKGVPTSGMALRAKHVGEYGEHRLALDAGFRKGDIVIQFDGHDEDWSETDLIAYALQEKQPGDLVGVTVVRDGNTVPLSLRIQK